MPSQCGAMTERKTRGREVPGPKFAWPICIRWWGCVYNGGVVYTMVGLCIRWWVTYTMRGWCMEWWCGVYKDGVVYRMENFLYTMEGLCIRWLGGVCNDGVVYISGVNDKYWGQSL